MSGQHGTKVLRKVRYMVWIEMSVNYFAEKCFKVTDNWGWKFYSLFIELKSYLALKSVWKFWYLGSTKFIFGKSHFEVSFEIRKHQTLLGNLKCSDKSHFSSLTIQQSHFASRADSLKQLFQKSQSRDQDSPTIKAEISSKEIYGKSNKS